MRVIPAVALINIAALEAVSPPQNEIRELLKVCVCVLDYENKTPG